MSVRLSATLSLNMNRETGCIVQLGLAFLLVFTAFNSAGYIQEGVLKRLSNSNDTSGGRIDKSAGYNSLAIIYAVFTVANLVASPIVKLVSAKWAMVAGASCYLVFMIFFVIRVMEWSLYITSALLGFGAAILWTGQGTYITQNSNSETIGRNSSIAWAMLQMCGVCGGIFLYLAFPSDIDRSLTMHTVRLVYGSFSVINGLGILLLLFLRQPNGTASTSPIQDEEALVSPSKEDVVDGVGERTSSRPPTHLGSLLRQTSADFVDTLRLGLKRDMLLLTPSFFFSGVETAFWTGVYATCLTNATAFTLSHNTTYALNAIFIGIGEVIGGGCFGILGKRTARYGRNPIIVLGVLSHIAAYFGVFLILPDKSPIDTTGDVAYWTPTPYAAFSISFLLGLADACWNTQIYSLLGDVYKDNSAPAFALFKFWQSLASALSFVLSSTLGLRSQLGILGVSAILGCLTFFPVEFKAHFRARASTPKDS